MSFSDDVANLRTHKTHKRHTSHIETMTTTTTGTVARAGLLAALFAATREKTTTGAAAFVPHSSIVIARDDRPFVLPAPSSFVFAAMLLPRDDDGRSSSSSHSPHTMSGRERRANLSTYAPYSIDDGRVGIVGVVGSPDGMFGTGMGAGDLMIASSPSLPRPPPLLPRASSRDVVHVDRATPDPPPFVASSSSSSLPPSRYGLGSWKGSSSTSSSSSSSSAASGSEIVLPPPASSSRVIASVSPSYATSTSTTARRPIVAGNWKLNPPTRSDALTLSKLLYSNFVNHRGYGNRDGDEEDDDCAIRDVPEAWIFPPLPYVNDVMRILEGSGISVGVQNCGMHDGGAYTGEISPGMVRSIGCACVLLGHSERRTHFGETNVDINAKLRNCLALPGLRILLCVGETLEEYENGMLERVVYDQLSGCLRDIDVDALCRDDRLVIAYEPVWAIGTGLVASPDQAQDAHVAIRRALSSVLSISIEDAMRIRILYGGSVTPDNVRGIMDMPDVDGALVGGASLNADSFARIYDGTVEAYDGKKKASV
jgi:triosephosphate isomerase